MPLSPEQARATPLTAQEHADWLTVQIDAWLWSEWREPSRTCYHVPSYLKNNVEYPEILALVLQRYRPMWPHVHAFSTPAYSCGFIAFVTEPCETDHATA